MTRVKAAALRRHKKIERLTTRDYTEVFSITLEGEDAAYFRKLRECAERRGVSIDVLSKQIYKAGIYAQEQHAHNIAALQKIGRQSRN